MFCETIILTSNTSSFTNKYYLFGGIKMAKGWYILSTYLGAESKVVKTIRSYIDRGSLSSNVVLGVKVSHEIRQYVFIELDLPDWRGRETLDKICGIQGVIGFAGCNKYERPRPMSPSEEKKFFHITDEILDKNTINSNEFLIKSVRIVPGRTLNPRWKTDMQVIETDKGTFIDNVPSAQFGYFKVANPGYNWQSLVGRRVSNVKIFVSCGRKWINKQ